jgi:hypothetical protein
MVLAFYPALSVVEWSAVLSCWLIRHCRSLFRARDGQPGHIQLSHASVRPRTGRLSAGGGTFVEEGPRGIRWSGLVVWITEHSLLSPGAAKLNAFDSLPFFLALARPPVVCGSKAAEAQLAKIQLTGNSGTARRLLWTTRELGRERNELHRLLIAVDYRFPDSGITRPL